MVELYLLAKAGFVVIPSDCRFHGSTAKRDEWGGVDVDDVLNLVPALKSAQLRGFSMSVYARRVAGQNDDLYWDQDYLLKH